MFTLALTLAVAAPLPKAPAKEAPSLVGQWVVESSDAGEKVKPFAAGDRFTFTGDGKTLIDGGPRKTSQEWRYTLDRKRSPAEFEAVVGDGAAKLIGIYKVDGDLLTVVVTWGTVRPTKFDAPPDALGHVLKLKRAK
jgi:uncharacterized protein (TIGR03067 family)